MSEFLAIEKGQYGVVALMRDYGEEFRINRESLRTRIANLRKGGGNIDAEEEALMALEGKVIQK